MAGLDEYLQAKFPVYLDLGSQAVTDNIEDDEKVGHITDCICDMTDDDRTTEEDENRMSDNGNISRGRREQKEDSQTEIEINSNAKRQD